MSRAGDLELLRRFEPVIHYTRGEEFFPIDIARYVETCNLWVKRPGSPEPECLVPVGQLTLDKLAEPRLDAFGSVFYLKFADPLTAGELATYKLQASLSRSKFRGVREASRQVQSVTDTFSVLSKDSFDEVDISRSRRLKLATPPDPANVFHAGGGRLARVGYFSRFAHALYQFSLLARGRVPGDSAAAASITYQNILTEGEEYRYCGRVVRQNGWIVLQYWFLYAFNNWRSGFYGVNDHEADWEMICTYLSETPNGDVMPEWTAYASHDFSGDDLRRRWDDPELEKVGEHPVIYAGAGSHASYYTAGEYLVELEIPFLTPLARLTNQLQKFWREKLRQFSDEGLQPKEKRGVRIFRLPFVDYARGDGLSIGPGQDKTWRTPYVISEPPLWVSQYRGLWGIYTQDLLASEDAPAGPMYNRNGTVRRAWYDPLGWAGLDKIPTTLQALDRVREQHTILTERQTELTKMIEKKSHQLTGLGIEAAAVQNHPHLKKVYESRQEEIKNLSEEIDQLRAEFAENEAMLEAFNLHAQQLWRGEHGPARAHIRRASTPIPESELKIGRLMETWAAVSIGLILISLVGVMFFAPQNYIMGLIAILTLFIIIESTFRRRLTQLVAQTTITLAIVAALVLIVDFFPQIAIISALAAGGYMMWQNLKELRG